MNPKPQPPKPEAQKLLDRKPWTLSAERAAPWARSTPTAARPSLRRSLLRPDPPSPAIPPTVRPNAKMSDASPSLCHHNAPPPRTNRTRRVPHPVLIGHAASLTPCRLPRRRARCTPPSPPSSPSGSSRPSRSAPPRAPPRTRPPPRAHVPLRSQPPSPPQPRTGLRVTAGPPPAPRPRAAHGLSLCAARVVDVARVRVVGLLGAPPGAAAGESLARLHDPRRARLNTPRRARGV